MLNKIFDYVIISKIGKILNSLFIEEKERV